LRQEIAGKENRVYKFTEIGKALVYSKNQNKTHGVEYRKGEE
jgi:hypothetical protein